MKTFFAVAVSLSFSLGLLAQPRSVPPAVVPSAGALGGSYASVGMSRPLGGIAPPTYPIGVNPRHSPKTGSGGPGYRYVGPVYYVPNVYGTDYWGASPSTFDAPAVPYQAQAPAGPEGVPAPAQAPIVINQYFGSRDVPAGQTMNAPTSGAPTSGSIDSPDLKYYLIAYKDRSIYTALAYWIEGDIFHYVTTRNTHNQASLSLIDLEQTAKLNSDNGTPFSLNTKQN